ncbi:MAG: UDP-N-acetylmuramoyl-L-alanyl-D-glutamate--2,6-diaminopimelate ligase [Deltaproteobacteria bacterium]|nr:UDP-N-acetylmuramoyl-L-alanyl-D-glutamate--2,6-diaminopimelate ligase [Deltaproteobacteria bacterium]
MTLLDLLAGVEDAQTVGDLTVEIGDVRDDSRLVRPGDLFVAVAGTAADGRAFVADAVRRGAAGVVVERSPPGGASSDGGTTLPADFRGSVITVANTRHALALIAANRFQATHALTLSAVTGTNGKTTTTYLLEAMLEAAGIRTGVIGTVAYRVAAAGWSRAAPLTTPGALALHGLFADMRLAGAQDVVLEASSHALDQGRLDGCRFRVAGLTNLTQDHLDYHGSMDRYFEAKTILFERLLDATDGVAVLPIDLPEGRAMRERLGRAKGKGIGAGGGSRTVLGVAATVGTQGADVVVESAALSASGMRVRLGTPVGVLSIVSPLVGDFNLANIVLAVGMAIARGAPGLDATAIAAGLERLQGVPGRLERVANRSGVLCVVDYSHTPDALKRALEAVRPLVATGGRLLAVFGCGGDRDQTKRPVMGEVAAVGSDVAIVTSDNPRSEDPDAIIAMIVDGMRGRGISRIQTAEDLVCFDGQGGFHVVADRRIAIRRAVAVARAGDVLLIAGKGHEDYQIIGADRIHFDDREEAAAAFATKPSSPLGGEP